MCAIDHADPCDLWNEKQVKAAKAHECYECRRRIEIGETYTRNTWLIEGRWDRSETCAHCWTVGKWMGAVCGGYLQGCLLSELEEHWDEGYQSPDLERLMQGIRIRWGQRLPLGLIEVPDADAVVALAVSMLEAKVR